jgi:hypothetical protein
MTKKAYNLEPTNLEQAKQTLTEMKSDLDQIIAERDQVTQE